MRAAKIKSSDDGKVFSMSHKKHYVCVTLNESND